MSALARLAVPVAGAVAFLAISWVTVRVFRPKEPRKFFLVYALLLAAASAWLSARLWPVAVADDAIVLATGVLLQFLACLTMWNTFYSILWGFSGSLMHDLAANPALRRPGALVRSYVDGPDGVDRMMARRLPNLVRGGWITYGGRTLTILPKGRAIAAGTRLAYRVFSLGAGGGVK